MDVTSGCITVGSKVFWWFKTVRQHSRFYHGYVIKVRSTSVDVSPSGNHGGKLNNIMELPRAQNLLVIRDRLPKPSDISIGSDVIVTAIDGVGFSRGKVVKEFATWYGVELGNKKIVWGRLSDIRLLKRPTYCDSYQSVGN